MRSFILVCLALCVASCGTPLARTPMPTPASVFLSYPPHLQPTADRITECAGQQQHPLAIFTISSATAQSSVPGLLIQLQLGGPLPDGAVAYPIGVEELKFIVNVDNPTTQLTTEQLLAIYTGQQGHWDFSEHPLIEFWSYPEEDALRSLLESTLPGMPRLTYQAQIAATPQTILDTVADHSEAIGYLPGSWLENLDAEIEAQVKVISLEPSLAGSLTQPIIVTIKEAITPEIQALFGCLQQPED